jgi:hypothetical protein
MWLQTVLQELSARGACRRRPTAARRFRRQRPTLEALEERTLMSVFTVDHLTDDGMGSGLTGDLRYCLTQATDGDTIMFAVTGTITLTQRLPEITQSVRIEGPGANLLTVDGNTFEHVFVVANPATVTISSLTITDGFAFDEGGGIYNDGTLALLACNITGNVVLPDIAAVGGGIYNAGNLWLGNSTVSDNLIEPADYGDTYGGGIKNDGALTVVNSTITRNRADEGAGIGNDGTLTVRNSTISGNQAAYVGGIWENIGGRLDMRNTILALNSPRDLKGGLNSSGYNLIGDTRGGYGFAATDLLNVDPLLGPLTDNGGPTPTMALLPGSPAIGAGDITGAPRWDQRGPGYARIVNGTIDIGAFEVQADDLPGSGVFSDPRADLGSVSRLSTTEAASLSTLIASEQVEVAFISSKAPVDSLARMLSMPRDGGDGVPLPFWTGADWHSEALGGTGDVPS